MRKDSFEDGLRIVGTRVEGGLQQQAGREKEEVVCGGER